MGGSRERCCGHLATGAGVTRTHPRRLVRAVSELCASAHVLFLDLTVSVLAGPCSSLKCDFL